ncbi:hypothetical protein QFZ40_000699 [Arthrobacter pascens]|nr:hypothetical protein [Arthrobacter pascens]
MTIDNTPTNTAHPREESFERGMEALTASDGAAGQKSHRLPGRYLT